ncbi:transcriptional regulator, TetR family [Actinacidiphila yanglinensis]|uniref:Transcriptional regulator, TetR family n=1 Tax=Actinacidiphila yanglinensis TaxID=310779 RepID=A0A1H6CV59_9ACTN|nr:TetR/AcrR family transcriptional regulator [Actinacidiphila yanglinensis]SEG76738.1 transcriptional regulator, TetR family [Actinacidiphila yanglinensis]
MGTRAPRADALRNRARILTAAREAFARDGVDIPLDTIAERAGVGAGTVHRHFPTKEALVTAVIADRLDHLADRAAKFGDNPAEDFFTFLAELTDSARDNLALASALNGTLGTEGEASTARLAEALQSLLSTAQRSGDVRRDVTALEVHAILAGVLATESRLPPTRRGLGLEIAIAGLRPTSAQPRGDSDAKRG